MELQFAAESLAPEERDARVIAALKDLEANGLPA